MGVSIYVSPDGNVQNAGTVDAPLATLARAQTLVRSLTKAGGVTVTVRGGDYSLAEPLAFTSGDSGMFETPVLYRAVRLFVDGQSVFHDPAGTNPARPDAAAPNVMLAAGDHELAVALGSKQGCAWGVYLWLWREDCGADAKPILPQIHLE